MMILNELKQAEARRIAWRCRRGLLELDIVLQRFVALHFADLTQQELVAFDDLLAMPDTDFWHLLQDKNINSNAVQQAVINKINVT